MKTNSKLFSFLLSLFIIVPVLAFSGNEPTQRIHKTAEFTKIEAGGVFKISFKVGPFAPIVIEADDNAHDKIEVSVRNGVLKLSSHNLRNLKNDIKVTIVAPSLEAIDMSGASAFVSMGIIKATAFSVEASGASDVQLNVESASVDVDVSGAAKITIKGTSDKMKAEISGAAKFYAQALSAAHADVDASGAAHAEVNAQSTLRAEASGAAFISYQGKASVRSHTSGAGTIKNKN